MIFWSKHGKDSFINAFAKGLNSPIVEHVDKENPDTIVFRSIVKKEFIEHRLKHNLPFYYMDSGYFGNFKSQLNPNGWKNYHRIVKNNLQHNEIIPRPADRWQRLGVKLHKQKQNGNHILLVLPSAKPCKFYEIDLESWTKATIDEIKKHTDRPIRIRDKQSRTDRLKNTIYDDLEKCHAMVTLQSIAAVESVAYGVPAFTLAPTAADPVCDKDLSLIETPTINHIDKLEAWAHHLAYGQFHVNELSNGNAWRILQNESS